MTTHQWNIPSSPCPGRRSSARQCFAEYMILEEVHSAEDPLIPMTDPFTGWTLGKLAIQSSHAVHPHLQSCSYNRGIHLISPGCVIVSKCECRKSSHCNLIRPGCFWSSIALKVQNHGLKHQSFIPCIVLALMWSQCDCLSM